MRLPMCIIVVLVALGASSPSVEAFHAITPLEPIPRPAFEHPDFEGRTHHIEEWDGKLLVLWFWAPWNFHDRVVAPVLIDLQEKYRDYGLQIIGVAVDDNHQLVSDLYKDFKVNFPILLGDRNSAQELLAAYGNAPGLPYIAIVDRKGMLIAGHAGTFEREQLEAFIKTLL